MPTLRREGHHLAQITGQPWIVVYAENDTRFFWKVVPAQFTIQKGKDGKVEGLLFDFFDVTCPSCRRDLPFLAGWHHDEVANGIGSAGGMFAGMTLGCLTGLAVAIALLVLGATYLLS